MSKYGVVSGPYFPVFNPETGKYGPEITPYLDNFHAVYMKVFGFTILTILLVSPFYGNPSINQLSSFCIYENVRLEQFVKSLFL